MEAHKQPSPARVDVCAATREAWERILFYDPFPVDYRFLTLPSGDELYCVTYFPARLSAAEAPLVVLLPSFGLERTFSYLTLKRLARFLSAHGFWVVYFDYPGEGESMAMAETAPSFRQWSLRLEVALSVHPYATSFSGLVALVGFRFGSFLAFELWNRWANLSDAINFQHERHSAVTLLSAKTLKLLLLDPYENPEFYFLDILRRKIATDAFDKTSSVYKSRDDLLAALKAGVEVCVEGVFWTERLWNEVQSWSQTWSQRFQEFFFSSSAGNEKSEQHQALLKQTLAIFFEQGRFARWKATPKTHSTILRPPFWVADLHLYSEGCWDWVLMVLNFLKMA